MPNNIKESPSLYLRVFFFPPRIYKIQNSNDISQKIKKLIYDYDLKQFL